jgi:hypothetical protein
MDFNLNGLTTNTVSITDYKVIAPKLARVVAAFTGKHTRDTLTESITAQLKHLATPVENSFRLIKDSVAVGFIRANTEVRVLEDKNELRTKYKTMASNIMMDNKDKTLWEVKEGAGGKFLARHGTEDLSELVESAVYRRHDVPRLANLATASAAPKEFVAFASHSGDMDYGFCVAANAQRQAIKVVSTNTNSVVTIPCDAVATVLPVGAFKIPLSAHKRITAAGISREGHDNLIEYYTRLYSYNREYLDLYIEQINTLAVV